MSYFEMVSYKDIDPMAETFEEDEDITNDIFDTYEAHEPAGLSQMREIGETRHNKKPRKKNTAIPEVH